MALTVKLEGFAELEQALKQLGKQATQKASLRRALKKAAQPLADLARGKAPVDTGALQQSVIVGAKLNGRQAKLHRRMFRDDRSSVELFVGPSYLLGDGGRHGHLLEFGTVNIAPQPFMRPAWQQDQRAMLDRLRAEIAIDIDKAVKRAARRTARARAKA